MDSLRSDTEYTFTVRACLLASCEEALEAESVQASTAGETWQVYGTDSGFGGAQHLVSDGNTKPLALLYGADAPPELAGTVQLYYDPAKAEERGIKIGTLAGAPSGDPASLSEFQPLSGFGFRRTETPGQPGSPKGPQTFQIVPMSDEMGGGVRVFFEGVLEGASQSQVYWVDSQDGLIGRDFHSGSATRCESTDIGPDGPCKTSVAISGASDVNPGLKEVRQAKLVLPTLDDWRWDGAAGSVMVVTLHLSDKSQCSDTFFNMGYATWDGVAWKLEYEGDCPRVWPAVQAPFPVHQGGSRYKLYFNDQANDIMEPGAMKSKPMKVIYADAAATGAPDTLEFEDWESVDQARDISYIWADGSELSLEEESRLDDYQIYSPTGDPDSLLMLSNMACEGGTCGPPFVGMLVLLNP